MNETWMGGGEECGGGEAFLDVIERDIKPRVAARAQVDEARSIIFGHSIGGLLVLYALFTRTDAFDTYLALSPTISWNRQAVLDAASSF